ncbi:DUF6177 family protein [Actinomadura barringtoniae]|nr:DUF6177 family protein [Actinomadura barringtoniae]
MSTVDVLTDQAMVVLQDRPVVALSPWLSEAIGECADSGRTLQLVTPLDSRLSLPLRTAAAGAGVQWVVREADSYYEGLTGRPLHWYRNTFEPVPEARDYASGFTSRPSAPIGAQLTLVYRIRHSSEGDVSGPIDRLMQLLTGKTPGGWGPAEPLEYSWQGDRLTEYTRGRASSRVIVIGTGQRVAQALCEFSASGSGGLAEVSTVTVGYGPDDPPPLQHLPSLVGALAAEQTVASLFVQLTPGRADLTTEPRWTGAPAPVALAVAGSVAGPAGMPGQQVGPARSPLTLFPLGDGRSADGWQRHRHLMQHLQSPQP